MSLNLEYTNFKKKIMEKLFQNYGIFLFFLKCTLYLIFTYLYIIFNHLFTK